MRIAAALPAVLLTSITGLPSAGAADQTVSVLGCVSRGVESGCLVIKDRQTGRTYQINAANPRPDPGQNLVVQLQGKVTPGFDSCMQGPILTGITWSYTKMRCTAGE